MAQKKLQKAEHLVRRLPPRLFSRKYEFMDFVRGCLLFGRQRTPLQIIKDVRYITVTQFDRLGTRFKPFNKFMGFMRLLLSSKYKQIFNKVGLNMERLWKKIVR